MINKNLSKTLMPFFAAAVLAAFSACGDEITEVTQIVGMQVVEEGNALPKCTKDNEGALVYSMDSAAAYYCVNRKWTTMKGKDGKDGVDGKDGKNGVDGKNGKDGKNGVDGKNGENGKDGNDGKNGKNGENGKDGSDGKSCTVVAIDNGYKIVCGEDSVGVLLNGEDGQDGAKGDTGVAGTSCSAEEDSDGVKITCTDGKSFTLSNGANGKDGESFVDGWMVDSRDKQLYRVVTIGEQIWMAENLNYKTENSWCGGGSGENEGDCSKYGRLYTWAAAIDSAKLYKDKAIDCGYGKTCSLPDTVYGICPPGWHLPDKTEWSKLFTAVGGKSTAGKILKSQTGWNDHIGTSGNGTDAYGFSAFPAGGRGNDGAFGGEGLYAYFWSATEYGSYNNPFSMDLYYDTEGASLYSYSKNVAFSVRCLKD